MISTTDEQGTGYSKKTEPIHFPHDTFFRKSLAHASIARDFFQHNLPAYLLKDIDLDTLVLQPSSFIRPDGQSSLKDLVYGVNIKNKPGQLFLLWEHQSSADPWMALRIQAYLMDFFLQLVEQGVKELPPVLCSLFYHGKRSPYPYSCDLFDLFEDPDWAKMHWLKPFHLVDLTQKSDDELLTHGKAALLEMLQKNIRMRDIRIALEKLKKQGCFEMEIEFADYQRLMIKYIIQEGDAPDKKALVRYLSEALPEQEKQIMTIAQQFIQEGRKWGMKRGMQQGREQGMQQGREQGMQQGKLAMARNIALKLIQQGVSLSEVKQLTELPDEQIENLVKEKA